MLMLINLGLFIAGLAVVLTFPEKWEVVAGGLLLAVLGTGYQIVTLSVLCS
jgi:hypothetical protein